MSPFKDIAAKVRNNNLIVCDKEMSIDPEKYLLSLCRLYKGESENPFDEDEDEFKWYIWRHEYRIVKIHDREEIKKMFNLTDIDSYKS